jgi:hypothetical protein
MLQVPGGKVRERREQRRANAALPCRIGYPAASRRRRNLRSPVNLEDVSPIEFLEDKAKGIGVLRATDAVAGAVVI